MSARRDSRMNTTSKHPQPFPQTLSITAGQPLPTALNKSVSLMCGLSTLKFLAISIYTAFSLVPGSSLAAVVHTTSFSSSLLLIKIIYLTVGIGLDSQLELHCIGLAVVIQDFFVLWDISSFYLPLHRCAWFILAHTSNNSSFIHDSLNSSLY